MYPEFMPQLLRGFRHGAHALTDDIAYTRHPLTETATYVDRGALFRRLRRRFKFLK